MYEGSPWKKVIGCWSALFVIMVFVVFGCEGPKGPSGIAAMDKGSITGTVTESGTGAAITGATVSAGSSQATTDSSGNFTIAELSVGVYRMTASASGYSPATSDFVGVVAGQTATINIPLSKIMAAVQPPAITWPANYSINSLDVGLYNVGYNTTVNISANVTDPIYPASALTYSWTYTPYPQYGGVETPISGANTSSLTFTTDPMISTVNGNITPDQGRDSIVSIGPAQVGLYRIELTVTNPASLQAASSIMVRSAGKTDGLGNVPVGAPVYLSFTETNPNFQFGRPAGSSAVTSTVAASPYTIITFTPDLPGQYSMTETTYGNTLALTSGRWVGAIDSSGGYSACMTCHFAGSTIAPDKFTPWSQTSHATMFTRGINGLLGNGTIGPDGYEPIDAPPYNPAPINQTANEVCLSCHTVGYDQAPLVLNNGFDDVMKTLGWQFPGVLQASNWTSMLSQYPTLAALANIQCESCHGPNNSLAHQSTPHSGGQTITDAGIRIGWTAGVCSKCHDEQGPEWAASPHANLELAISEGAIPNSPLPAHCGRCHAAQGFAAYLDQISSTGNYGNLAMTAGQLAGIGLTAPQVQPQTCQACHDPHDATNPHQVRVAGNTPLLPAGFAAAGMGTGAVCQVCHNTRNGVLTTDFGTCVTGGTFTTYLHEDGQCGRTGPNGYSAPHTPSQADVLNGHNAYFAADFLSMHVNVGDTCAGCHMALNPNGMHAFTINDSDRPTLCANCHGLTSGDALVAQVGTLLNTLAAQLEGIYSNDIGNAVSAGNTVTVTVVDIQSDCTSNTAIQIVTPTTVQLTEIHGQYGLTLTLPSTVTINSWKPPSGKTVAVCPITPTTTDTVSFQVGTLMTEATSFDPNVNKQSYNLVLLNDSVIRKNWNYDLFESDSSFGIHNPTFIVNTLNSTIAAP